MNRISLEQKSIIQKQIKESNKIAVVSHFNPDGDAVGSLLGFYNYLKQSGKTIHALLPNEAPEFLHWMPAHNEIIFHSANTEIAERIVSQADTIFVLDFNEPKRVEKFQTALASAKGFKIMIDHHPMPSPTWDLLISDISSSSTAELVYEVIEAIDLYEMDKTIATCLLSSIITDTGCFEFNSSNPRTFEIVANLLSYGVEKDKIIGNIMKNHTEQRMKLQGYCLYEKMKILPQYHAAYVALSSEELKKFNYKKGDAEGLVDMPLSIKGINFTVFFTEQTEKIRISFRSRGTFNVNLFARNHFNGGGHLNAAGGDSFVSLEETVAKFLSLLPNYTHELNYNPLKFN